MHKPFDQEVAAGLHQPHRPAPYTKAGRELQPHLQQRDWYGMLAVGATASSVKESRLFHIGHSHDLIISTRRPFHSSLQQTGDLIGHTTLAHSLKSHYGVQCTGKKESFTYTHARTHSTRHALTTLRYPSWYSIRTHSFLYQNKTLHVTGTHHTTHHTHHHTPHHPTHHTTTTHTTTLHYT